MLGTVVGVVYVILYLYMFVLIGRLVLDIVQQWSRDWKPRGFMLVVAELVYTLTDPPLRFIRQFVKPVRLGSIPLDLSYTALFLIVLILMWIARALLW
ncbi:YggT family protein [Lipingzhangella sp. LS1_29]|uniref:YggT family protein n=1 Tax=Lipingzhangella rawalii TaxID=2055835 RepID=A0ABU2H273_9ACTN|nr:YggT family protein [Lipingzhangella rawalii]MDS1269391.1 YggT family protein [Lipingzhangella rawalii]